MRGRQFAVFVLTVFVAGTWAAADDEFPPTWRGQDGTVTVAWDWWGPEGWGSRMVNGVVTQANPGGLGGGILDPNPFWAYYDSGVYNNNTQMEHGRTGFLYINDWSLSFSLANYDQDRARKEVIVQITFLPGPGLGSPTHFYVGSSPTPPGDPPWPWGVEVNAIVVEGVMHADGWQTNSYHFTIEPNPAYEGFSIDFLNYPAYVDQVVVDTWCVPEPATLSLVALGGLALIRRRR